MSEIPAGDILHSLGGVIAASSYVRTDRAVNDERTLPMAWPAWDSTLPPGAEITVPVFLV
jgi:hypothetical protein